MSTEVKEPLFLWMQDFDNAELSPTERIEQLRDAVVSYNEENDTSYNPRIAVQGYEQWLKRHYNTYEPVSTDDEPIVDGRLNLERDWGMYLLAIGFIIVFLYYFNNPN